MNFEKKCKKCGTIQEHSLQQNCPNCGTKNAFTEEKVKEKTIKKCKNCGTIQEHSLQSICPKCGTKSAFDNSNNSNKISDKLGKDFICPKCLSFFGKENVPQKMLKKKEPMGCLLIIPAFFLAIPANIIILYLSPQPFFKDLGFTFCTIVIFFILWFVYNSKKTIKKCPICGREGDFVLANSKLGMKYVNEKIIKETIETNKTLNSNNERTKKENTINDIYSSWNADKK